MTYIAIIDDDRSVREGLEMVLSAPTRTIRTFDSGEAFLSSLDEGGPPAVAFIDLKMLGMDGLEVLEKTRSLPIAKIMISGHGDVKSAVQALKLGAVDFIEKPFTPELIETALLSLETPPDETAASTITDRLTPREQEVAWALNRGLTNKEVARELDLSPRTVEIHRARIFEKLEVRNLAGLVRLLTMAGIR